MPDVLILADDLSGAADCGIACVQAGLDAEVSLGEPTSRSASSVVAVDADTRILSPAPAAERVHTLTSAWAAEPSTLFFKKIDSTLRGHLGHELAAALKARAAVVPRPFAIFAPALPAHGRTTLEGVHYVHGRPLHETEMWRYEQMQGEARIEHMLHGSGLGCVHLDLATVRSDPGAAAHRADGADVLICDALDEADLASVARFAAGVGERAVWVGSAGLAYHLPHAAGLVGTLPAASAPRLVAAPGPALFVIGSASRRTWDQATVLLSSSDIHGVVIPPEVLLRGPGTSDWQAFAEDLTSALTQGLDVILLCDSQPLAEIADRPRLSLALAEMTATLRGKVGTLIASGGETARKVLDRWGVRTLQLLGELQRGVPISHTQPTDGRTLSVITKAGDFGTPDILLQCLHWVQEKTLVS